LYDGCWRRVCPGADRDSFQFNILTSSLCNYGTATYRNGPQTSFAAVDNGKLPKRSPAGYYLCSCSHCNPRYHSYFDTEDICTHIHFNWATMARRTLRISCAHVRAAWDGETCFPQALCRVAVATWPFRWQVCFRRGKTCHFPPFCADWCQFENVTREVSKLSTER
jgi:hypothetical protein